MAATQHYALRPKSDLVLFYGLAQMLLSRRQVNREFIARSTVGFEAFAAFVDQFAPPVVSEATGLKLSQLHRLAETIGRAARASWPRC